MGGVPAEDQATTLGQVSAHDPRGGVDPESPKECQMKGGPTTLVEGAIEEAVSSPLAQTSLLRDCHSRRSSATRTHKTLEHDCRFTVTLY